MLLVAVPSLPPRLFSWGFGTGFRLPHEEIIFVKVASSRGLNGWMNMSVLLDEEKHPFLLTSQVLLVAVASPSWLCRHGFSSSLRFPHEKVIVLKVTSSRGLGSLMNQVLV